MLHFTTHTVSTDDKSLLVKNIKTGAVGNQTRPKDSEESDYIEISKESYEQEQRASAIREVYVREVERRIAERYTAQEESAITRKALALMINPQTLSEESDSESAEKVIAEFNEYNDFAESVKADVAKIAPDLYEAQQKEGGDHEAS